MLKRARRADDLELAFVWNRTDTALENETCNLDRRFILRDLKDFAARLLHVASHVSGLRVTLNSI